MLMAVTTVLAALVALQWGYNPLLVAVVNGFFLVIELVFVAANMTKLIEGGWFPLLMAGVIAFLMLTWRTGWQLLEQQRSKLRQREDEFVAWVLDTPPIRLTGAAAIFTAASTGIPLALTHHLRHNRVLHERVLLIASITTDEPRVEPEQRIKLVPVWRRHHPRAVLFWLHGSAGRDGGTDARLPRARTPAASIRTTSPTISGG